MASGRMALGDAKSGHDVDPTLRPDSRLAFRRPGRQTHGAHRMQGIVFADDPPAPVPDGQLLLCLEENNKRGAPQGVDLPLPDFGVLPPHSHHVCEAFHGLGQVRWRENPPDESQEKLPGRPPDLEVSRRRYRLPQLRLGARNL